jgi:hypothetical protein
MNRKGFEFSFGWLFAIIAGATILFIAVYATTRFLSTEQSVTNTESAQSIGSLLSPLETSLESSRVNVIGSSVNTRIYSDCAITDSSDSGETFGVQKLSVSTQSGIGQKWPEPGIASRNYNKYIFSHSIEEGKNFYVITQPFSYPYKTADTMMIFSDEERYCFVNTPDRILNILNSTDIPTLKFVSAKGDCIAGSRKVCFVGSGCDVDVFLSSKSVKNNGTLVYYGNPSIELNGDDILLLGAIFSSPSTYECQVQRLAKRIASLASLYEEKSALLVSTSCSANIIDIHSLALAALAVEKSADIKQLAQVVQEVEDENEPLTCKLY